MYCVWLSKQSAGVCATRYNMARMATTAEGKLNNKCPNCNRVEKAEHLNVCASYGRTQLLTDGVETLEKWLHQDNRTDSELAFYLPKYILFRGRRRFASLGPMSAACLAAAKSQDKIGWRAFMEGKISKEIHLIQTAHCAAAPCTMIGDDWMKHFISHILHLSHAQWVFRNTTLHDTSRGVLRLADRKAVILEIEKLLDTDPADIPPGSRFLLEMDFDSLYRSSFEKQSYWVRGMAAAIRNGKRAATLRARRGASARRREARRPATRLTINTDAVELQLRDELSLRESATRRRGIHTVSDVDNPCNKRLRKPD